jgi:endonuclease YncB( thermonuclease family)
MNRSYGYLLLAMLPLTGSLTSKTVMADELTTGRATVIDGDTINIRGERIRLLGIDAPEVAQMCFLPDSIRWPCGRRASFALADFIGMRTVQCEKMDKDRWGRTVSKCTVQNVDLQMWMLENGLALAFRRYSKAYLPNEVRAQRQRRGLWSGQFQAPWVWRRDRESPMYQGYGVKSEQ